VFGAVHAGVAANAIPQQGSAAGTVRVLDREAWQQAPELITRLVHEVVAPTGATADVEYTRGVPPVVNEESSIGMLRDAATVALGPHSVTDTPQSMGGEDFSWYLEKIPGAMARLGVGRPGESLDLHQGSFDVDERAIEHGVRLLVHAVLGAFSEQS
jgi:amidohydrolase